jgi:ABC-type antimicrobial peptide transport system permease subunit
MEDKVTDYKQLALKYLKAGRGRCIITIVGVILTVMVLYGGLNVAYSALLRYREQARSNKDYEFILMTDSVSKANEIVQDERVAKAYTGLYQVNQYEEEYVYVGASAEESEDNQIVTDNEASEENQDITDNEASEENQNITDNEASDDEEAQEVYDNAIYATSRNPYTMEKTMKELCDDYGVSGLLNYGVASLYFQGDEEDTGLVIMVLVVLLIAYIFAIFAVGIIRNTLQMFMLEQVKDYGILRCIGCTKKQLRRIIYCMGFVLEATGLVLGIIISGGMTSAIGVFVGWDMGYHLLPAIPVLIAYLGDLYLLIRENSKLVVNMPPIAAVKGQFRIKKEKIKARGKGLLGIIFGIEGEYARKNVLRNRGRFLKTVFGLSISIGGAVAILGSYGIIGKMKKHVNSCYGEYQVNISGLPSFSYDIEEIESNLPSAENMELMGELDCVQESKKVYGCEVVTADIDEYMSNYTDEYLQDSYMGHLVQEYSKYIDEPGIEEAEEGELDYGFDEETDEDKDKERDSSAQKGIGYANISSLDFYGLSDEELDGLSKYLVDGTTAVDENGIVLVTAGNYDVWEEEDFSYYLGEYKHMTSSNYQVGDTIKIVDTQILRERMAEYVEAYNEAWNQERAAEEEADWEENIDSSYDETTHLRLYDMYSIFQQVYEEMVSEGIYNTYKVEGILDLGEERVWPNGISGMVGYTSIDSYLNETGYTEDQISGIKFKLDGENIGYSDLKDLQNYMGEYMWEESYSYIMSSVCGLEKNLKWVLLAVVYVFCLSSVNIINTTGGSIHMRRKEFAQLRVIGMSRDRLMKTVLLEGVMTVIAANVVGVIMGIGMYSLIYYFACYYMKISYTPALWVFLVGFIVSTVLIIGSIYVPVKRLPKSMAEDLTLEE